MKKYCLSIIVVVCVCFSDIYAMGVDRRFEFAGIIWSLSSMEKDSMPAQQRNAYWTALTEHFLPYKNHPLISFVKEMRDKDVMAYSDFVSAMNYAEEKDKRLSFNKLKTLALLGDMEEKKFCKLLDDFYRESHFDDFFSENAKYYKHIEERLNDDKPMGWGAVNAGWLADNLSLDLGNEECFLCVSHGESCFMAGGLLIGVPFTKSGGTVLSMTRDLRNIIIKLLSPMVGKKLKTEMYIPENSFKIMTSQTACSFNTYLQGELHDMNLEDWVARVISLMYIRENNPSGYIFEVGYDVRHGYIWQGRAMKLMENYEHNRDMYSSLWEFVPQMMHFIDFTAENYTDVIKEFDMLMSPHIVEVFPIPGSRLELGQDSVVFTVRFSEKMQPVISHTLLCDDMDWSYTEDAPSKRWVDDFTYRITASTEWIKKSGFRGFDIRSFFTSEYGIPLRNGMRITYKTN